MSSLSIGLCSTTLACPSWTLSYIRIGRFYDAHRRRRERGGALHPCESPQSRYYLDAQIRADHRQLIDFSKFLHGTPPERAATADAILAGFQTAGFIYLKNHPIPPAALRRAFARSADFFDQPLAAKLAVGWTTPAANRGYSSPGREKVSQLQDVDEVGKERNAAPDLKESFEIGRDTDPEFANPWPAEGQDGTLRGFRADMVDFFDQCRGMHEEVMRAIALGMGLDEGFFDKFVDAGDNTLRLLHYPAVKADVFQVNPGQVRAGEHSVSRPLIRRAAGGAED